MMQIEYKNAHFVQLFNISVEYLIDCISNTILVFNSVKFFLSSMFLFHLGKGFSKSCDMLHYNHTCAMAHNIYYKVIKQYIPIGTYKLHCPQF